MLFLKAITDENEVEYFNTQNILSIKPCGKDNKYVKILMGAGLYWRVKYNSIEVVKLEDMFVENK